MKRVISLLTIGSIAIGTLFYCRNAVAQRLPDFSWDTVPRYMHVRKATAFTPEEVAYLATFPLLTFEKTTGKMDSGSTERGTLLAAEAVKAINPRTKILYYRNILVHYSSYDADAALKSIPSAFLVDAEGSAKLVRNTVPAYDLSNSAVQDWWIDSAKMVCTNEFIDGLFVDGNIKVLAPGYLQRQVGADKKAAVLKAYHEMMKRLPEAIGPEKLIVANILRARFPKAGLDYLDYFDGSYIECFEQAVGKMKREEYIAKGIAAIQSAARKGKIIAFTMGMGEAKDTEMGIDEARGRTGNSSEVQERFVYALATYLICAERYSYFLPHDGYGVDGGTNRFWMKNIPEFARPLGAPKGLAIQDGWRYTREFEHASVRVDIQTEKANIVWHGK
ncbi:MAG: putative glycoside hydrolase [Kiritimatiellae bacterium]|jgi:hypothetical protein|nr:putative glycoside hydrolase [Kiritimatiellia bacterium]